MTSEKPKRDWNQFVESEKDIGSPDPSKDTVPLKKKPVQNTFIANWLTKHASTTNTSNLQSTLYHSLSKKH